MKKVIKTFLVLLGVSSFLFACSNKKEEEKPDDNPPIEPEVTEIGISVTPPNKVTYEVDEELDLTGFKVLLNYSNNTSEDVTNKVTLSNFDSSIAGTKTITVTYHSFTFSFNVTVNEKVIPVTEVGISVTAPTKTIYYINEELDLTGFKVYLDYSNGNKEDVTKDVSLSPFDNSSVGTKTITVSYHNFTDSFDVQVIEDDGYHVNLSLHEASIMMEHHLTLSASIIPTPTSGYTKASFKSSDDRIATVNNETGEVHPMGLGECDIIATYQEVEDRCHLTVTPFIEDDVVHVANVSINEENVFLDGLNVNKTLSLSFSPENASNKEVSWESSDSSVVTIDNNGKLTSISSGSSIITITSKDLSKTDSVNVVVKDSSLDYGYNHFNGYYGELSWNNSEELISKLYDIINDGYTPLTYSANWDNNRDADEDLYNHDEVNLVYSSSTLPKSLTYKSGNGGWQREHAFCASLMTGTTTGVATNTKGRATDFHNLFASFDSGNTSRGNKNFGYANKNNASYQDRGDYSFDNKNFEPSNDDKGRLSRAIFYMGVMYSKSENSSYQPLTIEEDYVTYDSANCAFAIGNLSTLLEWNNFDVDFSEYQHNESVYSYINPIDKVAQGNRNPFVDYPELAQYAFGALKDEPGDLKNLMPTDIGLDTSNPEIHHYAIKDVKTEYKVGEIFDNSSYTLLKVDHNLNESNALDSEDKTTPYTFTEQDVGEKVMVVSTEKNDIKVKVNVKEDTGEIPIDECKYYTGDPMNKNTYVSDLAKANLTLTTKESGTISHYSANGILVPKETKEFYLDGEGFTNVTEIAFKANTNKEKTFHVYITIDGEVVYDKKLTSPFGRGTVAEPTYILLDSPKSGKIHIAFTNYSENMYLAAVGINAD